jgi:hypothetical protein
VFCVVVGIHTAASSIPLVQKNFQTGLMLWILTHAVQKRSSFKVTLNEDFMPYSYFHLMLERQIAVA